MVNVGGTPAWLARGTPLPGLLVEVPADLRQFDTLLPSNIRYPVSLSAASAADISELFINPLRAGRRKRSTKKREYARGRQAYG